MLEEQYRMAPSIAEFPNRQFYGGRLRNATAAAGAAGAHTAVDVDVGASVGADGDVRRWWPSRLGQYTVVDVAGGVEERAGTSFVNRAEAAAVVATCIRLVGGGGGGGGDVSPGRISIITFYAGQAAEIRRRLAPLGTAVMSPSAVRGVSTVTAVAAVAAGALAAVQVSSVDGFQGGENDIVLLSCVRVGDSF
jgi:superfamily I DNA and/or RNA helicase